MHSMVAHLDAVTCLAVDPNGVFLMSGSKWGPSWLLRGKAVWAAKRRRRGGVQGPGGRGQARRTRSPVNALAHVFPSHPNTPSVGTLCPLRRPDTGSRKFRALGTARWAGCGNGVWAGLVLSPHGIGGRCHVLCG